MKLGQPKEMLVLSSTSQIKIAAITDAMIEVFWRNRQSDFDFISQKLEKSQVDKVDTDVRGVPPQPYGEDEIKSGVKVGNARLAELFENAVCISIETWLRDANVVSGYVDQTYIGVTIGNKIIEGWSEPFEMPRDAVEKSFTTNRQETAAMFVDPINPKDPYLKLSNGETTRQGLITATLIPIFEKLKTVLESEIS